MSDRRVCFHFVLGVAICGPQCNRPVSSLLPSISGIQPLVHAVDTGDIDFTGGHIYAQAEDRSMIQHAAEATTQGQGESETLSEAESQHESESETQHESEHEVESESTSESDVQQNGIFKKLLQKIVPKLENKVNAAVAKLPGALTQGQNKAGAWLKGMETKLAARMPGVTNQWTAKLAASKFGRTGLGKLAVRAAKAGANSLNRNLPSLMNKANGALQALANKAQAAIVSKANATVTKVEDKINQKLLTPAQLAALASAKKVAARKRALAKAKAKALARKRKAQRKAAAAKKAASRKARIDRRRKNKNIRQSLPNFGL
jgi:hypothetical protein